MHRWLSLLAVLATPALAQTTSSPPLEMNIVDRPDGSVITSDDQQNHHASQSVTLFCVMVMTNHTGDVTMQATVDGAVGGLHFNLLDSPAIGLDNTPIALFMGPGITDLPNINKALAVPPGWRIRVTIDKKKTGGLATGKVLCKVQ